MKRESLLRYSRQIMLPDFGEEGQNRLRQARVLEQHGYRRTETLRDLAGQPRVSAGWRP